MLVVSAMGHNTDSARGSGRSNERSVAGGGEMDMLLSTGEQVSASLWRWPFIRWEQGDQPHWCKSNRIYSTHTKARIRA